MLNIVLTFDYELFLGKNYATEKEVLFDPTDKIIKLLSQYNIFATFYADVCSVFAYQKEFPNSEYCESFSSQLQQLNRNGNDIQLHIHPHWMKARYENGWQFEEEAYRIHYFMPGSHNEMSDSMMPEHVWQEMRGNYVDAEKIISMGIEYLESLLRSQDKNYRCISYRAGGFCIQPAQALFQMLYDKGIKVDSSVALKQQISSEVHQYDYNLCIDKLNWKSSSGIIEVPIGSVQNSLAQRIIHGIDFASLRGNEIRGEAIHTVKSKKMNKFKYFFKYNDTQKMMSLDSMPYKQMLYGLLKYYKKYNCRNEDVYLAILGHPKMFDEVRYSNFVYFIKEILKNYQDKFRFATMREALEDLKGKDLLSYDV